MPRINRAVQFAPFDALKGLQDALRLKEYERERFTKGDLQPEKIEEISSVLGNILPSSKVYVYYFADNYYRSVEGNAKINLKTFLTLKYYKKRGN